MSTWNSTRGWRSWRRHHRNPFSLGVASGDPHPHGIVLWTRLAPEPLQPGGGMEPRPVEVRWEVAKDPRMRRLVRRGKAIAWPAFAHSVHVEVDGLDDARIRFFDGDRHGSMKARLSRHQLEVDWRIADRVGDPNAPVRTLRTFAVESGRPGIAQA